MPNRAVDVAERAGPGSPLWGSNFAVGSDLFESRDVPRRALAALRQGSDKQWEAINKQ